MKDCGSNPGLCAEARCGEARQESPDRGASPREREREREEKKKKVEEGKRSTKKRKKCCLTVNI